MAAIDEHKEYIGTIIDINDTNCAGRCKIKVDEIMEGMDEALIPWATPAESTVFAGDAGGNLSVPRKGTMVKVRFKEGDMNAPYYYGIQKIDKNLVNEIKNDYPGTQVITYDHDNNLSIMYQVNSGIRIYLKGSYVQINPDGMITLNHAGDTSIIQLDGDKINLTSTNEITINAAKVVNIQSEVINIQASKNTSIKGDPVSSPEQAVNGNALMNLLEYMASVIDEKYMRTVPTTKTIVQHSRDAVLNSKIQYVT